MSKTQAPRKLTSVQYEVLITLKNTQILLQAAAYEFQSQELDNLLKPLYIALAEVGGKVQELEPFTTQNSSNGKS